MTLEDKIKRMAESIYVARRKHSGKAADFLLSRGWTPVGNGLWRSPKNKQDVNLKRALKHERKWDTNAVIAHVLPDWPNAEAHGQPAKQDVPCSDRLGGTGRRNQ